MKDKLGLKLHMRRAFFLTIPHVIILSMVLSMLKKFSVYILLNPFRYFGRCFDMSTVSIFISLMLYLTTEYAMNFNDLNVKNVFILFFLSEFIFFESFDFSLGIFALKSSHFSILIVSVISSGLEIFERVFFYDREIAFINNIGIIYAFVKNFVKILEDTLSFFPAKIALTALCCFLSRTILCFLHVSFINTKIFLAIRDSLYTCLHLFTYILFVKIMKFCYFYNVSLVDVTYADNLTQGTLPVERFYFHQIYELSSDPSIASIIIKSKKVLLFLKTYFRAELSEIHKTIKKIQLTFDDLESIKFYSIPVILNQNQNIPKEFLQENQNRAPVFKKIRSYNFIEIFTSKILSKIKRKRLENKLNSNILNLYKLTKYIQKTKVSGDSLDLLEDFFDTYLKDLNELRVKVLNLGLFQGNTRLTKKLQEILKISGVKEF